MAVALASEALVSAAASCDDKGVATAIDAGANLTYEAHYRRATRGFFNSLFPPKRRWTTAVHEATHCALDGKPKLLARLLDAGVPLDLATVDRPPPLHIALSATFSGERRGPEVTALLLAAGADPNARYRGHSAAHALYNASEPSRKLQATAAQALLAAGVPAADMLCAASAMGDLAAVTEQLSSGLDPEGRCVDGTPLVAATAGHHAHIMAHLLAAGASANTHTPAGNTWVAPLHVAVADGWDEGTRLLLDAKADPNASNGPVWAPQRPPLAVALSLETPEARSDLASVLIEAGASRALFGGPHKDDLYAYSPRAMTLEEAAVQRVRVVMDDPEHPLAPALAQWGPQRMVTLLADDVPALPDVDRFGCTALPTTSDLKGLRTARTDGHWAQRWSIPSGEALVMRDRRPGAWKVLQAPGSTETTCQSLVGHPSSHLLLTLGPPAHADARTVVYDVMGTALVFAVDAEVVTGWRVDAHQEHTP